MSWGSTVFCTYINYRTKLWLVKNEDFVRCICKGMVKFVKILIISCLRVIFASGGGKDRAKEKRNLQ